MTFPDATINLPLPRYSTGLRAPNEHAIPFAQVTGDRLAKGLYYFIREQQRHAPGAWHLPDGVLYMHPSDYNDLRCIPSGSDNGRHLVDVFYPPFRVATPSRRLFGSRVDLITSQDRNVVQRGRPRLSLDTGMDVLL